MTPMKANLIKLKTKDGRFVTQSFDPRKTQLVTWLTQSESIAYRWPESEAGTIKPELEKLLGCELEAV